MKTVIGYFDTFNEASRASDALVAAGFGRHDINLIAHNTSGRVDRLADDGAASGAASGALAGGAIGGAAGLAVAMMGLAVPGIGPILAAGTLATTLAGAGAGAVAGSLIGGLTDLGIDESAAETYAEGVRRGGSLVTLQANDSRVEEAEAILEKQGAVDVDARVEKWRAGGWTGFDSNAAPYTQEQIDRERAAWTATKARMTGL